MKCKAKGCSKEIYPSELIKCIICNDPFHIQCQNITTAYYLANKVVMKKTWKCMACANITKRQKSIALKNKLSSQSPCASNTKAAEIVNKCEKSKTPPTLTKQLESPVDPGRSGEKNTSVSNSPEGLEGPTEQSISNIIHDPSDEDTPDESFTSPRLSRSVNEINGDNRLIIEDLQAEIEDLTSKLLSTQQELDNQLLENGRQNELIKKLTREVSLLTSICQAPVTKNMNSSKKPLKRHSIHQTIHFSSTPNKTIMDLNKHSYESDLNIKILKLEKDLEKANSLINQLEEQIRLLKDEAKKRTNPSNTDKESIINERIIKRKLHLVSTDRSKQVLGLMAETFASKWNYCHYSLPNRSTNNVMDMIPNIIKDLSSSDYCVILIGEEDFHVTRDYLQLVYNIRNTLKKCKNTNLIICLPTYICGRPLYNSRVEMFNKLLMLDIESQEYAFWIDPNAELTFDMFSISSGKTNHKGMIEVFKAIELFIGEIDLIISKNNVVQPLECCVMDHLQDDYEAVTQTTNTKINKGSISDNNHSFRN